MTSFKHLISAARLRTLPLAFSCIIVGASIAYYLEAFNLLIFVMAIITTLFLQILSNYANDLGDSEKGTDNTDRVGPLRAVQSGAIKQSEMARYIKFLSVASFLSGIVLLLVSNLFWIQRFLFIILGIGAIWAAFSYTKGKISYGYRGFGDFFVFIFFGIVGVCGSLFLYVHQFNNASILPAISVGALSTGVLHLNNMRDMVNDKKSSKNTIAIILGYENSRLYFLALILIAIVLWGSYVFTQNKINYFSFIYWVGFLPLILILVKFFKIKNLVDYDKLLKPLSMTTFMLAILFFLSQIF